VISYNLANGINSFKDTIFYCLQDHIQIKIVRNNALYIQAYLAELGMGFAYDLAIYLKQCEGTEYSVYFQMESRYKANGK
jgi:hypothetical protein